MTNTTNSDAFQTEASQTETSHLVHCGGSTSVVPGTKNVPVLEASPSVLADAILPENLRRSVLETSQTNTCSLLLNAYAKINLTLDVFSKRADGYHDIASVMQTINLSDTLRFTRTNTPGITFTCDAPDAPDVPTDATNLVVRAAQAVLDAAEAAGKTVTGGVAIHLSKRIPSQAGLGGGSSDAAAALRGVNAVLDLQLDGAQLKTLAAQLGSDVPFFLLGGTAAARGRGEKLTPLPDARGFSLVIVKPDESVSTGWAYNALDAIADRQSHRATKRMEEALRNDDQERVIAFQSNDFELPIFQHHPKLAWLHDELMMAGCLKAHLCGSGSALYGIPPERGENLYSIPSEQGVRIAGMLQKRYPRTYAAHTLERFQSLTYDSSAYDSFDDCKPEPAP